MAREQSITSIQAYQKCARRYHWRYVEGMKEEATDDMTRGSLYHAAMEAALHATLREGYDPTATAIAAARKYGRKHDLDPKMVTGVIQMVEYYVPQLGLGTDVMPYIHNGTPIIEYGFSVTGNGVAFRGKVDAVVVLSDGRKVLVDWKSRKTPDAFYTEYALAMDNQLFAYAGALRYGEGIAVDAIAQVQMSAALPALPELKKDKTGDKADDYSVQMGKTTAAVLSDAIAHLPEDEREALVIKMFERKKIEADNYFLTWSWLDPRDETVILRQTLAAASVINEDNRHLPVMNAFICKSCPFLRECRNLYLTPKGNEAILASIAEDMETE